MPATMLSLRPAVAPVRRFGPDVIGPPAPLDDERQPGSGRLLRLQRYASLCIINA